MYFFNSVEVYLFPFIPFDLKKWEEPLNLWIIVLLLPHVFPELWYLMQKKYMFDASIKNHNTVAYGGHSILLLHFIILLFYTYKFVLQIMLSTVKHSDSQMFWWYFIHCPVHPRSHIYHIISPVYKLQI